MFPKSASAPALRSRSTAARSCLQPPPPPAVSPALSRMSTSSSRDSLSVSFHEKNVVITANATFDTIDDDDDDEFTSDARTWYTKHELRSFRQSADPHDAAPRKNLIHSVLDLQTEQREHGIACDIKGLAKISKSCSKEARYRAFDAARKAQWELANPQTPYRPHVKPSSMRSLTRSPMRKRYGVSNPSS